MIKSNTLLSLSEFINKDKNGNVYCSFQYIYLSLPELPSNSQVACTLKYQCSNFLIWLLKLFFVLFKHSDEAACFLSVHSLSTPTPLSVWLQAGHSDSASFVAYKPITLWLCPFMEYLFFWKSARQKGFFSCLEKCSFCCKISEVSINHGFLFYTLLLFCWETRAICICVRMGSRD